jgi:CHASE2 domain-containing sensor protein
LASIIETIGAFRNRGVTVKNVNIPMLLLATLVIISFVGVGFAIALRNVWLIVLFIMLGFSAMGYGISLKKKKKK